MAIALRIFENSEFKRKNFCYDVQDHLIAFYKKEVYSHEKKMLQNRST